MKSNLTLFCSCCNSSDIIHEEKAGRGLTPKNVNNKNRRVSYRSIWDIYTCNNCGYTIKKLRRE